MNSLSHWLFLVRGNVFHENDWNLSNQFWTFFASITSAVWKRRSTNTLQPTTWSFWRKIWMSPKIWWIISVNWFLSWRLIKVCTVYLHGMTRFVFMSYRVRHKNISLLEVDFFEFYWFLKNQYFCIGKRRNKLKLLGVIYQIWTIGSKVMLTYKKLLSESAQIRQISTYQIKWKH